MANYNPHAPQNLGQEWVPIRNEGLVLNPFANSIERGYGFTIQQARNVSNVRSYVNEMPEKFFLERAFTASIYKRGYEDQSGPVRSIIIPCNAGLITSSGTASSFTFYRSTNVADSFYNPSALNSIIYRIGQLYQSSTYMWFAVNQYQNLLQNKRILGVNFLTTIDLGAIVGISGNMFLALVNDNAIIAGPFGFGTSYGALVTPTTPTTDVRFDRIRLGDVSRFFGITGANSAFGVYDVSQWTYNELARFEQSASNRISMMFLVQPVGVDSTFGNLTVSYAALEVFYCEESRTAFGTKLFQMEDQSTVPLAPINLGAMPIIVRTPAAAPVILQPGDYTVTFSESNLGDSAGAVRTPESVPVFNELRQLYEIPTVPGVEVKIPFPLNDEAINQTLTATSTQLIPQLSLHASGATFGTLWESHPYGRQSLGEAINTSGTFVSQTIDTSYIGTGASATYPWIRFWARRYGDTVGSLRAQLLSSTAQIATNEFDALDEIVDGWKEVTLRFDVPVVLSSVTHPSIFWSPNLDQNAGNRWEVLGAAAPAVTGGPGNQLAQVAAPHTLAIATYGQPVSGSTVFETWRPQLGPFVSAPAADVTSDASFILAQDAPTITGFGVVTTSMAISGIGQNCGINPCCIPTALLYNQTSWSGPPLSLSPGNMSGFLDTSVTNGWGSTEQGYPYTITAGAAADFPSPGLIRVASGATREIVYGSGIRDSDQTWGISVPVVALTQPINVRLEARYVDGSNMYRAVLAFDTTGNVDLTVTRVLAGVTTTLATSNNIVAYSAGSIVYVRFKLEGDILRVKVWTALLFSEPAGWMVEVSDISPTIYAGKLGINVDLTSGNTNTLPFNIAFFDNFMQSIRTFGYTELQRMDTVDTDWQTIAKISNPYTTSFKDYEARVAILSSYRIRNVDVNGFYGLWSSTVSVLPPAPGVSGGCVSNGHILIFTSNEVQDGSRNLAYSSVWMDEQVSEDFSFPEAGFVQMQAMYDRDFFVAFRPNERGGEQFSRTILVQAAAISPPTLADFRSLRDLAWDNLSYVCVRDEGGNRWLSTVLVPSGRVLRSRKLYLAPISIVEVTDTPSEVDPV